MPEHYILEGKTVKPVPMMVWAHWLEKHWNARIIKCEPITMDTAVSTVFLGLNHQYGDGPPLLFETLVFGGTMDGEMDRYATYDEAVTGHAAMCERVRRTLHEWKG